MSDVIFHWADLLRFYVVVTSILLIALMLRMGMMRVRDAGGIRHLFSPHLPPHLFSLLGFCVILGVLIHDRFERHGQPPDLDLWVATTATTLILVGVLINVRFTFVPPWRR